MSDEAILLLREIRNLLEFQIRHSKPFSNRPVPSEGGASWEDQELYIDECMRRAAREGK